MMMNKKAIASRLDKLTTQARQRPFQTILVVLALIAAILPLGLMFQLLVRYSVNVPFWDQWSYVDLIGKFHSGDLSLYDLWVQHNEHRYFFPRLLVLGNWLMTGWNIRLEIIMSGFVVTGTFTLLCLMLKRLFRPNYWYLGVAVIMSAWLLFSPVQWINWIWAFQLAFFMAVLFMVLTIWLLSSRDLNSDLDRNLFIAILSASIATYSLGNGLLAWPLGLGLLLARRSSRRSILIWLGSAVVIISSYFYSFERSGDSLSLVTILKQPVAVIKYLATYLGRNLAYTQDGALYTGYVLLAVFGLSIWYIYRRGELQRIWGWLALAAYGLLTAGLAAVSRLNFGVQHAMVFSYTTISVTFVISVIVLALYALRLAIEKAKLKSLPMYVVVFFISGLLFYPALSSYIHNYGKGTQLLKDQSHHHLKVQQCVYTARSRSDECLKIVFPQTNQALSKINILKTIGWGDFK